MKISGELSVVFQFESMDGFEVPTEWLICTSFESTTKSQISVRAVTADISPGYIVR